MNTSSTVRATMNNGEPLPSFNEGFGNFHADALRFSLSTWCSTCKTMGLEGTSCSRCHFVNRDKHDLGYPQSAALLHQSNNFNPQSNLEGHDLKPNSYSPSVYSSSSINPSPVLQNNSVLWEGLSDQSDVSSTLLARPNGLDYLQGGHEPQYVQSNGYKHIQPRPIITVARRNPPIQFSEKNTRHCDAEKTRRDCHTSYIDLSFSLAKKFHALDFLGQDGHRGPKLTKQKKLEHLALLQFRNYLPRDKKKMRAWLDEEKTNGERLRRDKARLSKNGGPRGRPRKGEITTMSLKDEAVFEVLEIMEGEFEEFYSDNGQRSDEMEYSSEHSPYGAVEGCIAR